MKPEKKEAVEEKRKPTELEQQIAKSWNAEDDKDMDSMAKKVVNNE